MDTSVELDPVVAEILGSGERRRPGRLAFASPELIPLLRGTRQVSPDPLEHESDGPDQLRAVRGLGLGLLCSLLLWALLGAIAWLALTTVFYSA